MDTLIPGPDRGRYERSPEEIAKMRSEIEGILNEVKERELGKKFLKACDELEVKRSEWDDEEERLARERVHRELEARMKQMIEWEQTHSWLYGHRSVTCVVCHVNKGDMKGPCRFGDSSL